MNKNFRIVSRANGITKGKGVEKYVVHTELDAKTVTDFLNSQNDGNKYSFSAIDPPQVYTAEQVMAIHQAQMAVVAARNNLNIVSPVVVPVQSVDTVSVVPVQTEAFTMPDDEA